MVSYLMIIVFTEKVKVTLKQYKCDALFQSKLFLFLLLNISFKSSASLTIYVFNFISYFLFIFVYFVCFLEEESRMFLNSKQIKYSANQTFNFVFYLL